MSKNYDGKIAEIHATLDRFAKLIADDRADSKRREAGLSAQIKDTNAQIKDTGAQIKDTGAQIKDTGAQVRETLAGINALREQYKEEGDRWGKIAESLLSGELAKVMLERFGIKLSHIGRNITFEDVPRPCEIDVIGVNGDLVTVVEAKTTLAKSDINKFKYNVLDHFTSELMPEYRGRKIYGGVAYIRVAAKQTEADVIAHAEQHGLFVVKIIGDSNKIVNSDGFEPLNHHP